MKRSQTTVGHRFFAAQPLTVNGTVRLAGDEGRHLATVMRARRDDEVLLFDGSGAEFTAVVTGVHRGEVELQVRARHEVDRELGFPVRLGVALPRGDRQRWLVEKAVELGVSTLVPLVTERGVAQPTTEACRRLERTVIEASKQCGRNRLLEIAAPQTALEYVRTTDRNLSRWFAHPQTNAGGEPAERTATTGHALAIGPEGGFSDEEVMCARQEGWTCVDLGARILRIETAAIVLCARVTSASGTGASR